MAYYFAALAVGLLAGLSPELSWLTVGLMALITATLFIGDHPRLFGRYRQQTMHLEAAHTNEQALRAHLEPMLGGRIVNLAIKHVDLVNDTTLVEVRYRIDENRAAENRTAENRAAENRAVENRVAGDVPTQLERTRVG